jgi:hypothetical protein
MTHRGNQQMHEEHLRWRAENDFWRDEVGCWQAEAAGMVKDLHGIETALRHHEATLGPADRFVSYRKISAARHVAARNNTAMLLCFPRCALTTNVGKPTGEARVKHQHQALLAHWAASWEAAASGPHGDASEVKCWQLSREGAKGASHPSRVGQAALVSGNARSVSIPGRLRALAKYAAVFHSPTSSVL